MKKIILIKNDYKNEAVKRAISAQISKANTKIDDFEKRTKITLSDCQIKDLVYGRTDEEPILAQVWPNLPEDQRERYVRETRIQLSLLHNLMDEGMISGAYMHLVNPRECVEVRGQRIVFAPDIDAYLTSIFEVAITTEKMKKNYEKALEIVRLTNELKADLGVRFDEFINYGDYYDVLEVNPYEFNENQPIK